jgi:serine/threonine-protein kinase
MVIQSILGKNPYMSERKLIANRYRVNELIGEGGMGAVYAGVDTRSSQPVAIKQLKIDFLGDNSEVIERFRREVVALRRLNHPNIVKLLGTAREGKNYYIIMEYLSGGSLADYLKKQPGGRLPIARALHLALDLADALTRAHRLNIVHRDLKPDNVLLTQDGVPRLTDFGIARIGDRTRMTQSGHVMGTGAYLSPEACQGRELDSRSDIWSFGIVLYEMLAGRRPFAGSNLAATITAILMESPPDIRHFRQEVPLALGMLLQRMLEKNREHRLHSARIVGAALEAILRGKEAPPLEAPEALNDLITVLFRLLDKWEAKAQDAQKEIKRSRHKNSSQAFFHHGFRRGTANSYKEAAQNLRDLLMVGDDTSVK